jgi:glycosyltransferase involved in cell wall biosynthesis
MAQQFGGDLDIIVVDNGSTDGTAVVARGYVGLRWPVRVVAEPRAGVNRARNAGIASTSSELILLCDADDIVEPGWVEELVRALSEADLVGGVAETTTLNPPSVRALWGLVPLTRPTERYVGFESPWGCNCGFRRAAWQAVSGFDPALSGATDEIEFFVRAQIAGWSVGFTDRAVVQYRLRGDARSVLRRRYQNGFGGEMIRARFGDRTHRRRVTRSLPVAWVWLLVQSPRALFDPTFRWTWRNAVARRAGQSAGWIHCRVLRR